MSPATFSQIVAPQSSTNLTAWNNIPLNCIAGAADGRATIRFVPNVGASFLCLVVAFRSVVDAN